MDDLKEEVVLNGDHGQHGLVEHARLVRVRHLLGRRKVMSPFGLSPGYEPALRKVAGCRPAPRKIASYEPTLRKVARLVLNSDHGQHGVVEHARLVRVRRLVGRCKVRARTS